MLPHESLERREAPRRVIDLAIEVQSSGSRFQGRTLDLSDDGLAVLLPATLRLRPSHAISFFMVLEHFLPDSPLQLEGKASVVRVAHTPAGTVVAFRTKLLTTVPIEPALRAFTSAFVHEDI